MPLSQLHGVLANAFVYYSLIIAAWALLHLIRKREFGGDFWGAVVIGEVLIAAQVIIGIVMVIQGAMPARWVHFLYGAVALIAWPSLFAFTRGEGRRQEVILWIVTSGILFGVALRAIATAGP
ncbi:MAG: hypothetical protein Kow00124_12860 [Anaerolineae bacterium]